MQILYVAPLLLMWHPRPAMDLLSFWVWSENSLQGFPCIFWIVNAKAKLPETWGRVAKSWTVPSLELQSLCVKTGQAAGSAWGIPSDEVHLGGTRICLQEENQLGLSGSKGTKKITLFHSAKQELTHFPTVQEGEAFCCASCFCRGGAPQLCCRPPLPPSFTRSLLYGLISYRVSSSPTLFFFLVPCFICLVIWGRLCSGLGWPASVLTISSLTKS